MKRFGVGILQVVLFVVLNELGNVLVRLLHCPLPGSMIGFAILFALLQTKVIRLSWVDIGGSWLISELLLFFIPAAVGVVQYGSLLRTAGLALLGVIAVSTVLVMASTGFVTEALAKRSRARRIGKHVHRS